VPHSGRVRSGLTLYERTAIDGRPSIASAADPSYVRPTLVYLSGSKSITIKNLEFRNPASVFHATVGGSSGITYTGLTMIAEASGSIIPTNTAGIDIGPATSIYINNTKVQNQDNCVAFNPGTKYVEIVNITCIGGEGITAQALTSGVNIVCSSLVEWGRVLKHPDRSTAPGSLALR
jgi:galacturan 1,4-alpha-galacturonidase